MTYGENKSGDVGKDAKRDTTPRQWTLFPPVVALAIAWAAASWGAGCSRDSAASSRDDLAAKARRPEADEGVSAAAPSAVPDASDALRLGARGAVADGGAAEGPHAAFLTAEPTDGKAIGHTSVVYKLKLEGGLVAAFKPDSKRGPGRYRGEVAAFRLARSLGLPNVPPALARSFASAKLRAALTRDAAAAFPADVTVAGGDVVHGALMPWLPRYALLPLEAPKERTRWSAWLRHGSSIADADVPLARQISVMVLFDFVTGNWDRFSGGNIAWDEEAKTVLFVDNDGAFLEPLPKVFERQRATFLVTERFSRGVVAGLRAFDAAKVAEVLGEERDGVPLLGEGARRALLARMRAAVEHVDAKIRVHGEEDVLRFE